MAPNLPLPERGGGWGRVTTFGDNRTNNHPHRVSPLHGGGNKAVLFPRFSCNTTLVPGYHLAGRGNLNLLAAANP
jgi:hypothetical protein